MSQLDSAAFERKLPSQVYVAVLWLVIVVVAAVGPYTMSIDGEFVLDDQQIILANPVVRSIAYAPQAFARHFLHGFYGAESLYYRPLVTVSFQADYSIYGPNATGFRLTNLALYVAVCVMVFVLARNLNMSVTAAGMSAVFFAVVPSHAESVGWISGRTDLIATLFALGSVVVFVANYRKRPRFSWPLAVLCAVLMCCAFFSKESSIVVPAFFVLYVWIFGNSIRRAELAKWVTVLLPSVAVYLIARHIVLGSFTDVPFGYYLKERIIRLGLVHTAYLRLMFVPDELRIQYYENPLRTIQLSPGVFVAWLTPVALVTVPILLRKRFPIVAFGFGWILIGILPVSDLIAQKGPPPPAERFIFTASVGSAIILGWLVWKALSLRPRSIRVWPVAVWTVAFAYVINAAVLELQAAQVYESNLSWSWYVHQTKPRWWIYRSTAAAYLARAGFLHAAAEEYEAVLKYGWLEGQMKSEFAYQLGLLYIGLNDVRGAARIFDVAVKANPKSAEAWRSLGRANLKLKRYSKAAEAYERARSLVDPLPRDHFELGQAYRGMGRNKDALREFQLAVQADSGGKYGKLAEAELRRGVP